MTAPRRPLGDMLAEVISGTLEALPLARDLRVRDIAVTLPVEFGVRRKGEADEVLGDLPRTVTRTRFDIPPGRLDVRWAREDAP
jgi:hypothetical protein